jgi:hypothetical protein
MSIQNFYLLAILNHNTKQFHLRVEDERGDTASGSIHSLLTYVASMAKQTERYNCDKVKFHWMMPFWYGVLDDISNCEQAVVAVIPALGVKEARAMSRLHRMALKQFYKNLGYTAFGVSEVDEVAEEPTVGKKLKTALDEYEEI